MGNFVRMIDIESLKETIDLHKYIRVLAILIVLESPVINFLEDFQVSLYPRILKFEDKR